MKAYVIHEAGGLDVLKLEDVPIPEVKPGWVLIRIKGFGLNRAEIMTRQGHSGDAVKWPRVIGIECVGEIVNASDSSFDAGQTVATVMGGLGRNHDGSYAEYTLVPGSQVIPLDTSLSWADLAALPEMYLTAWGVVIEAMDIKEGQTVLADAFGDRDGGAFQLEHTQGDAVDVEYEVGTFAAYAGDGHFFGTEPQG